MKVVQSRDELRESFIGTRHQCTEPDCGTTFEVDQISDVQRMVFDPGGFFQAATVRALVTCPACGCECLVHRLTKPDDDQS